MMGVILLFLKDINFLERWLPNTIGLIHFFNLGFLVMIIMGVLIQMLPVLVGVVIPKVLLVSRLSYFLITIGALFFPLGMIIMNRTMIRIGSLSAWSALFIFFSITLYTLQNGIKSFTLSAFKLSSLAALVTLVWAGRLTWGWTEFGEFSNYRSPMVELHIAWALFGFAYILIMGVTYKIIPMFYVTTDHSFRLTKYGTKIIFLFLSIWTIIFQTFIFQKYIFLQKIIPFIKIGISIVIIFFSCETFWRLRKRKRPVVDTSLIYWQISMVLFSFGAFFYSISQYLSAEIINIFSSASFGMALLSLITGMLYKIVPFLIWLRLSSKNISSTPTIRELLPDRFTRKQLYMHLTVIVFLTISIFLPHLKYLFSFFLLCSLVLTLALLFLPLNIYRNHLKRNI